MVVPHEGTWIEMLRKLHTAWQRQVVPHEGTWIEILQKGDVLVIHSSFPTRERGLK